MAYGVKVKNSSGNVVISNDYPTYTKRSDASRSSDATISPYYWFSLAGDLAATGDRILLLKPNVGQWISWTGYGGSANGYGLASNESSVAGVVIDNPKNLTDPAFGVLIRDTSGTTLWSSGDATAFITDGVFKDFASYDDTYTRTFTGCNAGTFSGGGARVYFDNNAHDAVVMARTATSTLQFYYREVYPGVGSGGGMGSVSYTADLFMLTGNIS